MRRLCIARAIANQPKVLLMDKPCSALDPIATARIEELITELKAEYTIVTHDIVTGLPRAFFDFRLTGCRNKVLRPERLLRNPQRFPQLPQTLTQQAYARRREHKDFSDAAEKDGFRACAFQAPLAVALCRQIMCHLLFGQQPVTF